MAKKKSPAKWLLFGVHGDAAAEYNYALAPLPPLVRVVAHYRRLHARMMAVLEPDERPTSVDWFCYLLAYGDVVARDDTVESYGTFQAFSAKPKFKQARTDIDSIAVDNTGFYFTAAPKSDDGGERLSTTHMPWADWDNWLAGRQVESIEGPNP